MLISLGYLVLVITFACGPFHMGSAAASFTGNSEALPWWSFAGLPVAAALAALATLLPMRVGARNLQGMEF